MRRLMTRELCAGAMLLAILAPSAAYTREGASDAPLHHAETTPADPRDGGDQPATTADNRRLPPDSTIRHKLALRRNGGHDSYF